MVKLFLQETTLVVVQIVMTYFSFDPYIDVDNQLSEFVYILPHASMNHVIDTYGNRLIELCQCISHITGNGRLQYYRGVTLEPKQEIT